MRDISREMERGNGESVIKMKIPNPVRLNFDPGNSKNPVLREVFNDIIAKMFWLGITSTHKVKKGFNQRCLFISEYIRGGFEIKKPEHLEVLLKTFMKEYIIKPKYSLTNGEEKYSKSFVEEFYSCLMGEKNLEYIINLEK